MLALLVLPPQGAQYGMTTDEKPDAHEDDARLPDEAVVMRGGLSTPDTLQKTALRHFDVCGEFAISVRSKVGLTADDLAAVEPALAYPSLRETTVGALRGAGYEVVPDEPPPAHALVMLPPVPADDDYLKISAVLTEPRENPVYRKEAR